MLVQVLIGRWAGCNRHLPDDVAKVMLADGRATAARKEVPVEMAVAAPVPERAVRREGRPNRRRQRTGAG